MSRRFHHSDLPLRPSKRILLRFIAVVCLNCLTLSTTASIAYGLQPAAPGTSRAQFSGHPALGTALDDLVLSDSLKRESFSLAAPTLAANGAAYEPPAATLVITPAAGVFGSVPVGTKSPVITFTAQNNTTAAVTYTGSSGLGEFNIQPGNCNIVNGEPMLAPGATCSFNATFVPTAPGPVSGSLTIATNSGNVSVPISGTGAGLLITPASETFGNVPIGGTSPTVTFTAQNFTSATAFYVNSTGLSEFNVTPGTCHLVNGDPMLAAGGTCTFTASFKPTTSGVASGVLNISTSSGPVVVPISGVGGTAQGLVVTPGSGAFGNVPVGTSSPTLSFTAHNYASSAVSYAGWTGSQEFFVQPGNCHIVNGQPMLASGQSCTFTAAFKPTAAGPANGTLNITTASGPFSFPLSGTGIAGTLPTANAGGPYTGTTGHPVTFQGGASTAPSGQTLTAYNWNFGDGTSGTGVSPTHTYSAAGTYNVSLTVTDSGGVTNLSATTAKIVVPPNPLTIKAAITPAPNAAGWNNSPVTVNFTCATTGSPIVSCPAPQTVSTEGAAQIVTGTVTDANGDTATASVTVNLALTPPVIAVLSPGSNATITLSTSSIGVSGTVSSNVASIVSVTCKGLPATLSGPNFACTTGLTPGANAIPIVAKDIAGNISTFPLALTYAVAPALQILAPVNLGITNLTPVTLNGTVNDPNATITVDGVAVPQSGGAFSVPVPLVEGLNILTAVATNTGGISTTATVEVTLDTTPPHVLINSPANGTVLTAPSVTVTGLANDVVVGTVNLSDLKVTVNGVAAQVANRSFSAMNVPLALGSNTIQATGTDRAGNGTTTSVTVTRVLPSQPPAPAIGKALLTNWINIVSGNNQTGTVGAPLAAPVVVSLTDSASHPLANQMVVFKVTANNGVVNTAGGTRSSALAVNTDVNGLAQVTWTLGQRAGAGNNTLTVSSALAVSPVTITANGSTGNPTQIVVDSGNNQTGVLGQPLPFPFVVDVIDAGHNRVPGIPVVFSIKQGGGNFAGAPTLTVTSDINGRAIAILTSGLQEGINNNIVEASFAGNPGMPAAFVATAKAPGNPSGTTISGVVLDNSNNPIQSVTIRLYKTNQGSGNNLPVQIGTPVETDAQGTFTIAPAPVGALKLMADGSTAAGTLTYPTLEYDIVTVAGNDNTVGMPIYLPSLDTVNKVCVDETHGGILTLPQYPGFALNILAGSATFPGGSRTGCVSATPVNGDKVPMSPGFGQQPRFIVTIQPVGTMFNPPAAMTLPNVDGLAPKSVIEMYSYDHDLAMFVAIGTGTVSSDGSAITSDPGVGVVKAGWHCGGDPNTIGSAGTCPLCQTCTGDSCAADPSQDGTVDPDDKCMQCMDGSLEEIPLNETEMKTSISYSPPQPAVDDLNEALEELKTIGVIASVDVAKITGEYSTQQCCSKETGVGSKKSGSVEGDFGSFTVKGKIWPPGPIPEVDKEFNVGAAMITVKAEFDGGVFLGLMGSVSGTVGYHQSDCAEDEAERSGCFFASLSTALTPSISGTLGGEASLSCKGTCLGINEVKGAISGDVVGQVPLNISNITYNSEEDCTSGLQGGVFMFGDPTFTISAKVELELNTGLEPSDTSRNLPS